MQTAGVAIQKKVPFSVYGECLIIMVQNFLIILLMWHYNKSIGFLEKVVSFSLLTGYAYALFTPGILTMEMLDAAVGANMLLTAAARIPQIYTIFSQKSTGTLAFFTVFLQTAGGAARIATVFNEVKDWSIRMSYVVGFSFNATILMQFFCYWSSSGKRVGV